MGQAQKKNYCRFTDNFLGKEKIIKRWKFLGKPRITPIHRWFSGRKPDATGPKLTFSGSNTHDWPGQPIQNSVCLQKIVIISHQSLKKGHREGKNIPPGQIPLYVVWLPNRQQKANKIAIAEKMSKETGARRKEKGEESKEKMSKETGARRKDTGDRRQARSLVSWQLDMVVQRWFLSDSDIPGPIYVSGCH